MADRTRDGGVEERTEGQRLLLYRGMLVRVSTEFAYRDQKSLAKTEERWNMLSYRILRIEGSAEYSLYTRCVDRPSRSHHEQFPTQGSAHRAY